MNKTNHLFVKITTIYTYALLTVFLFFCGSNGYQGILGAKFSMFCVVCGGYVFVMVLLGVESILIGSVKLPHKAKLWKKASWTQRFALAYLIFTWCSALISPYRPETVIGVSRYEGALTITIYVLCFLLLSVFGRVSTHTLTVFCLSVTLFGVLCVLQLSGFNPLQLYPSGYSYADAYTAYSGAYLGTIGNVDLVAAFLCLVIPILWVGLIRLKGYTRVMLLIPLVLSVFVLMKMSVLAGLVGVFAGGVLVMPVVVPLPPKYRWAMAGAFLLAAMLFIVSIYLIDPRSGMFHEIHSILHGDFGDTFGSGRIHIWKSVLELVPSRPWFGFGPDTMLCAGIEPFTRYDEFGRLIVSKIDVAHNEYLNILYHQGVFALAAYLLALGSAAWKWLRTSAADPVCAMLGGGVLCYCVQAFFGFSMCITTPFFWLALGVLENRCKK